MPEKELENLVENYPNILDPSLHRNSLGNCWMKGSLGEVNVFLRQEKLVECDGRLDIAFITDSEVHIAEIKDVQINGHTLIQLNRYIGSIKNCYPNHVIKGYLVGQYCKNEQEIQRRMEYRNINIITIPNRLSYTGCRYCGAGVNASQPICPVCRNRLI